MDYSNTLHKSLEFIEENLDDTISLDDLAQRACLSKFHFHRLFHRLTGETVTRYVGRRRMASAARELIETDRPIIDIALKYQYSSQESFSRAFKRAYSVTPGRYRRAFACEERDNIRHIGICPAQIQDIAA